MSIYTVTIKYEYQEEIYNYTLNFGFRKKPKREEVEKDWVNLGGKERKIIEIIIDRITILTSIERLLAVHSAK